MHVIMATPRDDSNQTVTSSTAQCIGLLGGPLAWFMNLLVEYALVPVACANDNRWVLHLATAIFLALAAAAGFTAFLQRSRAPAEPDEASKQRTHFLGTVGVLSCALFFLVIAAQGVPSFVLDPCWN